MNAKNTWGFNPKWLTSNNETRNASDFLFRSVSLRAPEHKQKLHNFNLWSLVILNTKENEYINLKFIYDWNYFVLREFKIFTRECTEFDFLRRRLTDLLFQDNEIIQTVLYSFDFCWNFFLLRLFFLFFFGSMAILYAAQMKNKREMIKVLSAYYVVVYFENKFRKTCLLCVVQCVLHWCFIDADDIVSLPLFFDEFVLLLCHLPSRSASLQELKTQERLR